MWGVDPGCRTSESAIDGGQELDDKRALPLQPLRGFHMEKGFWHLDGRGPWQVLRREG